MSFSDEDYQQNCTAALEIMEIETPFILYTWIRNTLLECLEHADMIMDMDGFQVDAGTAPVRDDPDRPYPAFYAHMANDPFGSSEETNCVNFNGGLRATRHIFPGEEILWDYGPSYHMDLTARMTRTCTCFMISMLNGGSNKRCSSFESTFLNSSMVMSPPNILSAILGGAALIPRKLNFSRDGFDFQSLKAIWNSITLRSSW
eukprot:jgi/Mesvir1/20403/Mv12307-RA.1